MPEPSDLVSRLFPNRTQPVLAEPSAELLHQEASVSEGGAALARFRALIDAKQAEIAAQWSEASALERQGMLTDLSQLKQGEALMSGRLVPPENALDHKHNALMVNAAQAVIGNSIKLDENSLKRAESSILPRLMARLEEEKLKMAGCVIEAAAKES